jgi:hypothetical protein
VASMLRETSVHTTSERQHTSRPPQGRYVQQPGRGGDGWPDLAKTQAMTNQQMRLATVLSDSIGPEHIPPAGAFDVRPRWRLSPLLVALSLALFMAAASASRFVWLQQQVALSTPQVPAIDLTAALVDNTPITVTITVGDSRMEWPTTVDDVKLNMTLWRSMRVVHLPIRQNRIGLPEIVLCQRDPVRRPHGQNRVVEDVLRMVHHRRVSVAE